MQLADQFVGQNVKSQYHKINAFLTVCVIGSLEVKSTAQRGKNPFITGRVGGLGMG